MKIVVGLGNPGPEYDATRHNVGWWVVDRLAYDWSFGPFARRGLALQSEGSAAGCDVLLLKPTTYMNRSGVALREVAGLEGFAVGSDLLVVVDDAALDVGKVRFRSGGSAGGHNGLRSVQSALRTDAYSRLRIGVGRKPEGADLADWVLSEMSEDDEGVIVDLLPELTHAVELWIGEGTEAAMNRYNR